MIAAGLGAAVASAMLGAAVASATLGPTAFAAIAWGAIALVLAAFAYVVGALLARRRATA